MTEETISPFKFIVKYKHEDKKIRKLHSKSFKTLVKSESNTDCISKDLKKLKFLSVHNTPLIHKKSENLNKFLHIQKFKNNGSLLCNKEESKQNNSTIKRQRIIYDDNIQFDDKEFPIISTNANNNYIKEKIKKPFITYNSNKIVEKCTNYNFLSYIFSNFKPNVNTKPACLFAKTLMSSSSNNTTNKENSLLLDWSPSKKKNTPFLEKGLAKTVLDWIIEYQLQNTLHNYSNTKIKEYTFVITETKKDTNMNNIYFYGYEESAKIIEILFLLTEKYLEQNKINEGTLLLLHEPITRFQNIFPQNIIICINWNHKN
ncbi:hypothetical protein T552_03150 [Pneumocystis carinii B80]|uniref:Uncharacterized protein n=1 Tax=Pneumocystis carinii (strain B80) TaxID=1408658 RepID=A0A0W4ZBR2_PNEC8|nr:hypothetical protein T552_03150 [Pneumocystis carinii B80]KTW25876.1 hypothetical protein T552_03150 [Pneumocystis carinii B80]